MFEKILVPLDGSKLAECVLDHVKEIATGCQVTEVVLLSVLDINLTPSTTSWGLPVAEALAAAEQEKRRQKLVRPAMEYLTEKSEQLKAAGIAVRIELLEEGPGQKTAELILLYSQDNDFNLIIMSSHGRSGISRFAFGGNVADKVMSHSVIPVLLVIPAGCRLP